MLDALAYFATAKFWFSSFLALLLTFAVALLVTGPTDGRMKWQINLVGSGNRFLVMAVFVVLEFVFFLIGNLF
jgi:hypothetical protein